MKSRLLVAIVLVVTLIGGCTGEPLKTPGIPEVTKTSLVEIQREVRPGVYMSNVLTDFSLPATGYTVYIVGEAHGNRETKQVFQNYLKDLYQEAGLRDVVLEEHQAYEPDTNAYVLGKADVLPEELCRRADILGLIRDFNATLPEDGKVTVHLVDVDSPLPVIYKHLTELHAKLGPKGASMNIPPLSEVETWGPKSAYDLIAGLQSAAAGQPDVLQELATLRLSFRWYFGGHELDGNSPVKKNFVSLREEIITQNI